MEINYSYVNGRYQRSSNLKGMKSTEMLNLKQFQDEVDKKIRKFELVASGFFFPLKTIKRILTVSISIFCILFAIYMTMFYLNLDWQRDGHEEFARYLNKSMNGTQVDITKLVEQNKSLQGLLQYYDCKNGDGKGDQNIVCMMKNLENDATVNQSSSLPAEAKEQKQAESKIEEKANSEIGAKLNSIPDVNNNSKPIETVPDQKQSEPESNLKKQSPKVETNNASVERPSEQYISKKPASIIGKTHTTTNKNLNNHHAEQERKNIAPSNAHGQKYTDQKKTSNPNTDSKYYSRGQTVSTPQYTSSQKPAYNQQQSSYNSDHYSRPNQNQHASHSFPLQSAYEGYGEKRETYQSRPSYETTPQYNQGYQKGRIPIEVDDFNDDQNSYQDQYAQYSRGRKLAEVTPTSEKDTELNNYKNSFLVFENRVYQIGEPSTGHLGFFRKLMLGLVILNLIIIVVTSSTYIMSEREILKKVNDTIIDMVIDENSESGIYKFFIYGNFQFIGVKVNLLTEQADDSKLTSLHSDSYMLDQNLPQSRKLHLIKKNKVKKTIQRNGNYKNVSQNNGDSFNLDGGSILLNDSTN